MPQQNHGRRVAASRVGEIPRTAIDACQLARETGHIDISMAGLKVVPKSALEVAGLQVLILNSNSLSSLPTSIGKLSNLQIFSADWNKLQNIPPSFSQLKSLKMLSLGFNQFTSIPASVCKLSQLQSLCMNDNKISILPASLCMALKSLTKLNLRYNCITLVPIEIGSMPQLTTCQMAGNCIENVPVHKLADSSQLLGFLREPSNFLTGALPARQHATSGTYKDHYGTLDALPERTSLHGRVVANNLVQEAQSVSSDELQISRQLLQRRRASENSRASELSVESRRGGGGGRHICTNLTVFSTTSGLVRRWEIPQACRSDENSELGWGE